MFSTSVEQDKSREVVRAMDHTEEMRWDDGEIWGSLAALSSPDLRSGARSASSPVVRSCHGSGPNVGPAAKKFGRHILVCFSRS